MKRINYTITPAGSRLWCLNGLVHREDGPAVIRENGYKAWWTNGHLIKEENPNEE